MSKIVRTVKKNRSFDRAKRTRKIPIPMSKYLSLVRFKISKI